MEVKKYCEEQKSSRILSCREFTKINPVSHASRFKSTRRRNAPQQKLHYMSPLASIPEIAWRVLTTHLFSPSSSLSLKISTLLLDAALAGSLPCIHLAVWFSRHYWELHHWLPQTGRIFDSIQFFSPCGVSSQTQRIKKRQRIKARYLSFQQQFGELQPHEQLREEWPQQIANKWDLQSAY